MILNLEGDGYVKQATDRQVHLLVDHVERNTCDKSERRFIGGQIDMNFLKRRSRFDELFLYWRNNILRCRNRPWVPLPKSNSRNAKANFGDFFDKWMKMGGTYIGANENMLVQWKCRMRIDTHIILSLLVGGSIGFWQMGMRPTKKYARPDGESELTWRK